jgi:hypothetical protein
LQDRDKNSDKNHPGLHKGTSGPQIEDPARKPGKATPDNPLQKLKCTVVNNLRFSDIALVATRHDSGELHD